MTVMTFLCVEYSFATRVGDVLLWTHVFSLENANDFAQKQFET